MNTNELPFELNGKVDDKLYQRMMQVFERLQRLEQQPQVNLAELKGSLSAQVKSEVVGLFGAYAQTLLGTTTPQDPQLQNLPAGSVTSFSAGDLTPLFTTTETNQTTTPALAFAQIVKAKNLVYAGPATGADANPDFRALDNADLPGQVMQTYTPTWTNVDVTGATITAKYVQIGKIVFVRVAVVLAAVAAVSGSFIFSLPVTSVSYPSAARTKLGGATIVDSGTDAYDASIFWQSTTTVLLRYLGVTGTLIDQLSANATAPMTWTTNDEMHCQFFYEAA